MDKIIEYVLNMIPYMLIVLPVYLLVRFIIVKNSCKKINWYHESGLLLLFLFIVGLLSQAVIPRIEYDSSGFRVISSGVHRTNLIPFKVFGDTYNEVFVNGNINYFLINFLGNIIMFMPVGFLNFLLWDLSYKFVIVVGFSLSFFIEFCQLFLARGTDVDDLILNTIGVIFGLLLYKVLYRKFRNFMIKFR